MKWVKVSIKQVVEAVGPEFPEVLESLRTAGLINGYAVVNGKVKVTSEARIDTLLFTEVLTNSVASTPPYRKPLSHKAKRYG